jgi:hypothetical protein
MINNINNNPFYNQNFINKNPLVSEGLEQHISNQQVDDNKMLGKIRERSVKNNKLVYVHAKLTAPQKKKYPNSNTETSNESNNRKGLNSESDKIEVEKSI